MEEAFERYGPGVIEAVSGFSGGDNENPVSCVACNAYVFTFGNDSVHL